MPQHPLQGSQPCPGEGACVPQWSSEPGHAGLPKTDRSQWRILTKRGLQEEEMVIHSSVLAVKTPWAVWKVKKMISEYTPHPTPKLVSVWYATGEEWRAPERMKQLGQSGKNAQLWLCLVMKVKITCYKEQYCIGTWNVRSMNQGKLDVVNQEMSRVNTDQHLRNQWIKMDRNGQI